MKKAQIILIALSAAFICLITGFFMGRNTSQKLHISSGNTTGTAQSSIGKLDLNTATAHQLEALPGIGPVLAQNIVRFRQENGSFTCTEDLLLVPGLGPKRLAEILDYITVGG